MLFFRKRKVTTPAEVTGSPTKVDLATLIANGNALERSGDWTGALTAYNEASTVVPDSWEAHLNAGNALSLLGRTLESERRYHVAQSLNPTHAGAPMNLGNLFLANGKYANAEASYRAAIPLRTQWAEPRFGLACALEALERVDDAIDTYNEVMRLDPAHERAAANLCGLLARRGDSEGALRVANRVLARNPDSVAALWAKADVQFSTGQAEQAVKTYAHLHTIDSEVSTTYNAMLFAMNFCVDATSADILAAHIDYGAKLSGVTQRAHRASSQDVNKRLKIGYVSPDFRRHSVACFIEPVLRNHDRAAFEVFCYFNSSKHDDITERFFAIADHWRDIPSMTDDAVARMIEHDEIDILIDLTGHTAENRLRVFARKPAPVQCTWLGYLCTTGLKAIDYRLCDFWTDPEPGAQATQVEIPMRFEHSQWCYQPQLQLPDVSDLPMLRNGYWTFGSFNQAAKLNDVVLKTWARLLKAVPESRLRFVGVSDHGQRAHIAALFADAGVSEDRLHHLGRVAFDDYFACYRDVDIALDSFPYNGATTSCDALIMGVPVMTVAGERAVARGGVSLLTTLGLTDWIAQDVHSIIALAVAHTADPLALATLRRELPRRMRESPLMGGERFTRDLETLLRSAWRRWCSG